MNVWPRIVAKYLTLAALVSWPLSPAAAPLSARPSHGLSVSWVSSGVRLTLSVARTTYSKDALVPVTVRVGNLSAQTIWLTQFTGPCGGIGGYGGLLGESPVQVLDAGGNVIRPWTIRAMEPGPMPICGSTLIPVQPAQSFQQRFLAILVAPRIRAQVEVGSQIGVAITPHFMWTPALTLTLTKGVRPRVRLVSSGGRVYAQIVPRRRESRSMYYLMWEECAPGSSALRGAINSALWEKQRSHTLASPCTDIASWHAVAGWLNQPVATVDYPARSATPPSRLQSAPGGKESTFVLTWRLVG